MPSVYVAQTKPLHSLAGLIPGIALLYFGLDIRWFHTIPGSHVPLHSPIWLILSAVGGLLAVGALKAVFSPTIFMTADADGITLFSSSLSKRWNSSSKSFDTTRRVGDRILIPWAAVVEIGEGVLVTGTQVRGARYKTLGGTSTMGAGRVRQSTARALKVLCHRSVQLQGYGSRANCEAWNGYTDEDLKPMSRTDRARLTADDLNSGFLLRRMYLKGGVAGAVSSLRALRHHALGDSGEETWGRKNGEQEPA